MDFKVALLLITAGANFGLGVYILMKDLKQKTNIFFSLMLFSIAAWSTSLSMYFSSSDVSGLYFWIDFNYSAAAFIALFFYYFCMHFPYQLRQIGIHRHIINFLFCVLVLLVIFSFGVETDFIFDASRAFPSKVNPIGYSIFSAFFYLYIISSFVELWRKYAASSSYHRRLIGIVFGATLMAALFGALFDLFFIPFTTKFSWTGPIFTLLMVFILVRYLFIKVPE